MFRRVSIYLWLALLVMGATICHANPVIDVAPFDENTGSPFTGMVGDRGPNALTIPVLLTNDVNVGQVAALGFVVKYDPLLLEFNAAESLDNNKQASTNVSDPNRTAGEIKVLFAGINNAVILNGVDSPILNLRFNILPSATEGDTTVDLMADPAASTPDALEISLDNGNQSADVTIIAANPAGSLSLGTNSQNGGTVSADPPYDPDIPYNIGNIVNLYAAPATGYTFANWSCIGIQTDLPVIQASNSLTLVDSSHFTCTANFNLITYNLTLNTNPANTGTFISDPPPKDPSAGAEYGLNKFVPNTSAQVTFTPSDGYSFIGWSGTNCVTGFSSDMDNPLTVVMSGAKTCTAKVTLTPVSGTCGTSADGNFPAAPAQNLCSDGSTPQVTEVNEQWSWSCVGANGGANVNCTANVQSDGLCGTSTDGNFPAAPAQNLCGDGSLPDVSTVNGLWTWRCVGTNGGASATCTANYIKTNNTPVAADQNVSTPLNTALPITLEATDSDNDPLVYVIVAEPAHGTLTGSGGNLTYTPDANYFGDDSFNFKANDGEEDSSVATVGITVTASNDQPTLTVSALADGSTTKVQVFNLSGTFSDMDGIAIFSINGVDITPIPQGSFSYAYDLSIGENTFTAVVTDVLGNTTTDTRTITYDPNCPQLTVSMPADNSKTKETLIPVEGTILDENATVYVSVNGNAPAFVYQGKGNFSTSVLLTPDMLNTIEIIAEDLLGNRTSVKRSVANDLQGPDLAITDPVADTETTDSSYILKGTVSTDAVGISILHDGTSYDPTIVNGTFEQVLPLPTAKTYQASVSATDDLGNSTTIVSRNIIKRSTWNDVSAIATINKSFPVYDRINNVYYVRVRVTNPAGNPPLSGALRMVVTNPSPTLKATLAGMNPNGTTVAGEAYYDLVPDGGMLSAGTSISNLRLNFEIKLPITFGIRIEQLQ